MYTWLIWLIVQSIATIGILYGGGKWGALELIIGIGLVIFVFILSLRQGTKNITKSDGASLFIALGALAIWWLSKNARLAILMVTIVDLTGYLPTIRKTYIEPWSETLVTWVGFTIGNLFSIIALKELNFLTLCFIFSTTVANTLVALIIITRRSLIKKSRQFN